MSCLYLFLHPDLISPFLPLPSLFHYLGEEMLESSNTEDDESTDEDARAQNSAETSEAQKEEEEARRKLIESRDAGETQRERIPEHSYIEHKFVGHEWQKCGFVLILCKSGLHSSGISSRSETFKVLSQLDSPFPFLPFSGASRRRRRTSAGAASARSATRRPGPPPAPPSQTRTSRRSSRTRRGERR